VLIEQGASWRQEETGIGSAYFKEESRIAASKTSIAEENLSFLCRSFDIN